MGGDLPHRPQILAPAANGSYCDTIIFTDAQFGGVAAQLYNKIEQNITRPGRPILLKTNKTGIHSSAAPHKQIAKEFQNYNQTAPSQFTMPFWTGVLLFSFVFGSFIAVVLFSCSSGYKRSSHREIGFASDLSPSTSDFSPPA